MVLRTTAQTVAYDAYLDAKLAYDNAWADYYAGLPAHQQNVAEYEAYNVELAAYTAYITARDLYVADPNANPQPQVILQPPPLVSDQAFSAFIVYTAQELAYQQYVVARDANLADPANYPAPPEIIVQPEVVQDPSPYPPPDDAEHTNEPVKTESFESLRFGKCQSLQEMI